VLEDLDLIGILNDDASIWAQHFAKSVFVGDAQAQEDLMQRFLILPDSVFAFLAETATEIRARIATDSKTGTVKKGALWYEENLPAETVLWGIYALSDSRVKSDARKAEELAAHINNIPLLQLGGKAGVGHIDQIY
jgi:CRISPR-associated protein Cmr4